MTRPTAIAAYAAVLLLLGLALLRREILILCLPLLSYLAFGTLLGPGRLHLRAARSQNASQLTEGEVLELRVSVVNEGPALEGLLIRDSIPEALPLLSGSAEEWIRLPSGAGHELCYTVLVTRGVHRWGPVRLVATDALGISQAELSLETPTELVGFPQVHRLKPPRIRPRATRGYSGMVPTRRGGPGVEFLDVRLVLPGEPVRRLNWRASSRHPDLLFINELEQERVADVGIVLDARHRSNTISHDCSMLDYSARAAASLASALLRDGNRVALLIYGGHLDWTFPGYGKTQWQRILMALARCRAGDSEYFDQLEQIPSRLFPPYSQLVVVSPLLRGDVGPLVRLRARSHPLLVISPDPVSLEAAVSGGTKEGLLGERIARVQRDLLLRSLRRAGIRCIEWVVHQPLIPSIQPGLSRPESWFRSAGIAI